MSKVEKLLETYRDWQDLLASAPACEEVEELCSSIYRQLRLAPGFDAPDLEALHREAYPDASTRPPRLVPTTLVLADVLE